MKTLIIMLAVFLAGCHPCPKIEDGTWVGTTSGLSIYTIDDTPTDGLLDEVDRAVEFAAWYWDAPASKAAGWMVVIRQSQLFCDGKLAGGCCSDCNHTIELWSTWCRTKSLPHELGHVFIDDPDHKDPRWADVELGACGWLDPTWSAP